MAKTELTRKIETYLRRDYDPTQIGGIALNKMRPHFTGLEVPVECGTIKQGLVDAIRIDECFVDEQECPHCVLSGADPKLFESMTANTACPYTAADKEEIARCDNRSCRLCHVAKRGTASILVTAFEIKVSVADFHSKHGHNFCGNCNFYVLPVDVYEKVKDDIPDGIGVLVFYDGQQKKSSKTTAFPYYGLRKKVECEYRPLSERDQLWLLLSVMKRIQKQGLCDAEQGIEEAIQGKEW